MPVATKVVLASTPPLGPVMLVVGVWSSIPKDSNFLTALVGSLPPVTATVLARICSSWLPVTVTGSDQAVAVALALATDASRLLAAPQVTRSSWRYRLVLRSWISTWTRRTRPGAVAHPSITNWTPAWTTRPSIGLVMVVSIADGAGLVLKS